MKEFKRVMEFDKVCDEAKQHAITIDCETLLYITVKAPNRPARNFGNLMEATAYIQGLMDGIESATCGGGE